MKKRLVKKSIKKMLDRDLYEHVAYCENKRFRRLVEKEFNKRFKKDLERQGQMTEDLMHISSEVDKMMKPS